MGFYRTLTKGAMHAQSISRPAARCGSRQQRDRAVGVRNHVRRDRHHPHNEHHERPKLSRPPVLLLRRRRTAQHDFALAADAYGVPEPVLLGVSYMEPRRDDHGDHPSTAGGYGPMHLTDVPLSDLAAAHAARGTRESRRVRSSARPVSTPSTRPASRPGLSVTDLKSSLAANICGGAALLASYQKQLGHAVGSPTTLNAWTGAVRRYSATPSTVDASQFARRVYTLMHGVRPA